MQDGRSMGRILSGGKSDEGIAEQAWQLIEEVEALGGMAKAIEAGIPKLRIEESAAGDKHG